MEIWEIIIISLIGVSAAGYLMRIFFGKGKKKPPCISCPHTSSCDKQELKPPCH